MYVNVGVGIPTLVPKYINPNLKVIMQCENGSLGLGKYPTVDQVDPEVINAGKETVTINKGASFFSFSESHAMIRGKHLDVSKTN